MSAKRFNKGKLRWALMDFESLEEMLKVFEMGAIKYDENNWKKGLHREEILESVQRHLAELFKKKELDPESKLQHMAHIMCNGAMYLFHYRNKSFSKKRNNPFKKSVKGSKPRNRSRKKTKNYVMSKYSDRLLADKKTQDVSAAAVAEAHAKASVEQEVAGIKAKIATNTAASEAALGANPFNVKEVLRLQKEKESLSADLASMSTILTEQF